MPLQNIDVLNAIPPETPPEHVVRLTEIATTLNDEITNLQDDLNEAGRDLRAANNSKEKWRTGAIFAGLIAVAAVALSFFYWPKHNDEQYAALVLAKDQALKEADSLRPQLAACIAKPTPVCTPSQGGAQSGTDSPTYQYGAGKDIGTLLERTEQIGRKVDKLRQELASSQGRASGGSGSSTTPRQPAQAGQAAGDGSCTATFQGKHHVRAFLQNDFPGRSCHEIRGAFERKFNDACGHLKTYNGADLAQKAVTCGKGLKDF